MQWSRRLRVALRRVVESKGNLAPWGDDLIEGDDGPARCHTPPHRRGDSEQRHLLTHDPFCDSPAIIELAHWHMDREEDRVWALFLEGLSRPVGAPFARGTADLSASEGGYADDVESVVSRIPTRRPGRELSRGGGDQTPGPRRRNVQVNRSDPASSTQHGASSVVTAAEEARSMAEMRLTSGAGSPAGSGRASMSGSVRSGSFSPTSVGDGSTRSPSNPANMNLLALTRSRLSRPQVPRRSGDGNAQVGAMTTQVETNRSARRGQDAINGHSAEPMGGVTANVQAGRRYDDSDGLETTSLLGGTPGSSTSRGTGSLSMFRTRSASLHDWDRDQSSMGGSPSEVGTRRPPPQVLLAPDPERLRDLPEERLNELRRPPARELTAETELLMETARQNMAQDPQQAAELMINAQQALYNSGVTRPSMISLAEECLRQVGAPRMRPHINNIEWLMTIRWELERKKIVEHAREEAAKGQLDDTWEGQFRKMMHCLTECFCCCGIRQPDSQDQEDLPPESEHPRDTIDRIVQNRGGIAGGNGTLQDIAENGGSFGQRPSLNINSSGSAPGFRGYTSSGSGQNSVPLANPLAAQVLQSPFAAVSGAAPGVETARDWVTHHSSVLGQRPAPPRSSEDSAQGATRRPPSAAPPTPAGQDPATRASVRTTQESSAAGPGLTAPRQPAAQESEADRKARKAQRKSSRQPDSEGLRRKGHGGKGGSDEDGNAGAAAASGPRRHEDNGRTDHAASDGAGEGHQGGDRGESGGQSGRGRDGLTRTRPTNDDDPFADVIPWYERERRAKAESRRNPARVVGVEGQDSDQTDLDERNEARHGGVSRVAHTASSRFRPEPAPGAPAPEDRPEARNGAPDQARRSRQGRHSNRPGHPGAGPTAQPPPVQSMDDPSRRPVRSSQEGFSEDSTEIPRRGNVRSRAGAVDNFERGLVAQGR